MGQGLSLTLLFEDTPIARDLNKAQIYAWPDGIENFNEFRLRQMAIEGTEVSGCMRRML